MLSSTSSRAVSSALFKNCAPPAPSHLQLSSTSSRFMKPATRLFSSAAAVATRSSFSASSSSVSRISRIQPVQRFSSSPARCFSPTAAAMGVAMINNETDFQSAVNASKTNGSKLTVIDFYAQWCGPCKVISPKMVEYSEQYPGVSFYKIDVDETPDVAAKNGIRVMPTIMYFKNGEKVDEVHGAAPPLIEGALKKHAQGE